MTHDQKRTHTAKQTEPFHPVLFDFTRKSIAKTRGQGTIEYILMLAGALMVVALVANFLLSNVLTKQTATLGNQSDQIKDYKKQLQQQTTGTGPGASGNPPTASPTASPVP
ncbi:class III signal peptide-containing protein [Candidatus Micrarchaeota archaeon]|nr:class III signal peptide-containing protein [Candidatus Micrarchaeota archaeon]